MEIINVYQYKKYKNNKVPQGLGDFIRGCFCLVQICNQLNISFDIAITHPIHLFLNKKPSHVPASISKYEILNYPSIYPNYINHFFNFLKVEHCAVRQKNFVYNTSFPLYDIQDKERVQLQKYFEPNKQMLSILSTFMNQLNIHPKQYDVIHIRAGDEYLNSILNHHTCELQQHAQNIMNPMFTTIIGFVRKLITSRCVIISDNNIIKTKLKEVFPDSIVYFFESTHTGGSLQLHKNDLKNTLLDFYIMSLSNKTTCISNYDWGSGFSKWCCELYNVPYKTFFLEKYNEFLIEYPETSIKLTLITTFYECPEKYTEWMHCVQKNITNANIKKIILFIEGFEPIKTELDFFNFFNVKPSFKVQIVKIKSRPSFYTLIEYSNKYNANIVIANADIYFENLNVITDLTQKLFMLTRYSFDQDKNNLPFIRHSNYQARPNSLSEYRKIKTIRNSYHPNYKNANEEQQLQEAKIWKREDKCYANEYSSDAWFYQTPFVLDDRYKDVYMGTPYCSHKITKLFVDKLKEGYTFENPCLSIKAIHYDFSETKYFVETEDEYDGVNYNNLFVEWSYL